MTAIEKLQEEFNTRMENRSQRKRCDINIQISEEVKRNRQLEHIADRLRTEDRQSVKLLKWRNKKHKN